MPMGSKRRTRPHPCDSGQQGLPNSLIESGISSTTGGAGGFRTEDSAAFGKLKPRCPQCLATRPVSRGTTTPKYGMKAFFPAGSIRSGYCSESARNRSSAAIRRKDLTECQDCIAPGTTSSSWSPRRSPRAFRGDPTTVNGAGNAIAPACGLRRRRLRLNVVRDGPSHRASGRRLGLSGGVAIEVSWVCSAWLVAPVHCRRPCSQAPATAIDRDGGHQTSVVLEVEGEDFRVRLHCKAAPIERLATPAAGVEHPGSCGSGIPSTVLRQLMPERGSLAPRRLLLPQRAAPPTLSHLPVPSGIRRPTPADSWVAPTSSD